jgi:hypothetical protein
VENCDLVSHGWFARSDAGWNAPDNFARIVTQLCVEYENVYCEVGYLHQMLDKDAHARSFKERFGALLADKGALIGRKVMFGSDWHMPSMISDADRYLDFFRDLFADEPFASYRDDFFFRNALRYLHLTTFFKRAEGSDIPAATRIYARQLRKLVDSMLREVQ